MATKKNKQRPDLTAEELDQVVSDLVLQAEKASGGHEIKLKRGALAATAKQFNLHPATVGKIWKRAHQNYRDRKAFRVSPQKKGKSGRKIKRNREEVTERARRQKIHTARKET